MERIYVLCLEWEFPYMLALSQYIKLTVLGREVSYFTFLQFMYYA